MVALRPEECGYTNRIHADDLAAISVAAVVRGRAGRIYNVCDGASGTMADFFGIWRTTSPIDISSFRAGMMTVALSRFPLSSLALSRSAHEGIACRVFWQWPVSDIAQGRGLEGAFKF